MRYTRLATFILVAGLGLLSGCQSSNPCGSSSSCSSGGGLMSRLGLSRTRSTPCCDSGVVGTPVSAMPYSAMPYSDMQYGGAYEGPSLGDPTYMGSPGTIMPNGVPPGSTLPPPIAGSDGVPRQLPGTIVPGTATPIPAGPSSRFRN
jgi:hypothetical protein